MAENVTIEMYEGILWAAILHLPETFPLTGLSARIRIVSKTTGTTLAEYDSEDSSGQLVISGQTLLWQIVPEETEGKSGLYYWQVMFYENGLFRAKVRRGEMKLLKSYVD